jgi:hypothetical protein
MYLDLEFEDEEACAYLKAKRCMEKDEEEVMDDEEFVAKLIDYYLETRKTAATVYDSDPEPE